MAGFVPFQLVNTAPHPNSLLKI